MTVREEKRGGKTVLVIDIPYRDFDGKARRYRRDSKAPNKTAAKEEEKRLRKEAATKGFISGSQGEQPPKVGTTPREERAPVLFDEALERYEIWAQTHLKHSTKVGYDEIISTFLKPSLAGKPLTELNAAWVHTTLASLVESKKEEQKQPSASRKRNLAIVVRTFWNSALEMGLVKDVPPLPALPKPSKTEVSVPSEAELERLLAVAKKDYAKLPLLLGMYAGLRTGEVRALRWRDVDLRQRFIMVRMALVDGVEGPPKSGCARMIPLDPQSPLFEFLAQMKQGEPDTHVCKSMAGKVWGENGIWQMLQRHCKRAGIAQTRFHSMRHAFVTGLFRAGVQAPVVQRLAGHSSILVTERYAHPTKEDEQQAIKALTRITSRGLQNPTSECRRGNSMATGL